MEKIRNEYIQIKIFHQVKLCFFLKVNILVKLSSQLRGEKQDMQHTHNI